MSFSVRDGSLSSKSHSPYVQAYKSPQFAPSGSHGLPPFSLPHTNSDDLPKRTGTDPTKYKTMICRNWEQTGTCSFRGCTFAHGVEELRAPMKLEAHLSPSLGPQGMSATSTPHLTAQNARLLRQNKLEYLLELLYSEVAHTRELASVHIDANRTLEGALRREQHLHEASESQLDTKRAAAAELMRAVVSLNLQIRLLPDSADAQMLQQRAMELLPAPPMTDHYAFTSDVIDDDNGIDVPASLNIADETNIEELLRMLGPQSPTAGYETNE